jgi:gluconokinase
MPIAWNEAETPCVLAIDIGTSSARALIFDRLGRAIEGCEAQHGYDVIATPDGGVEIDPAMLLQLAARCVDESLQLAGDHQSEIGLVAFSCFWHSLLGIDGNDEPVTPIYMWGDTRSRDEVAALRDAVDNEGYRQRTGVVIHSSYWPAKLRWLHETQPALWSRVVRWTSAADYFVQIWQGADRMSMPMASGTGLLDISTGSWSAMACDIAGIEIGTLPPIVDRDDPVTGLEPDWEVRWPALAAIPWYPAIGDGACANAGSGAIGPGRIALTLGTSGAVRAILDAPIGTPLVVPKDLWVYRLDKRRIVLGAAISNGGNVVAWFADLLGAKIDDNALGAFRDAEADSHGLTVLPFLSGERSPLWSDTVTGVVAGLTLSTDRARIQRAVMESVSLRLALLAAALLPQMDRDPLIIANGGALLGSPVWQRITCDAIGAPLTILAPTEETGARGAAVLALEAHGAIDDVAEAADPVAGRPTLKPDPRAHARYLKAGERQARLMDVIERVGL